MEKVVLVIGADIEVKESKIVRGIVGRFCNGYGFKLVEYEGPFSYHEDKSLAQVVFKVEVKVCGQFTDVWKEVTDLLEHCVYLQSSVMFQTFKPKENKGG